MSYDFPNEINRSYFSCFKEDALKKDYKYNRNNNIEREKAVLISQF